MTLSPTAMLELAGLRLYGSNWRKPLADALRHKDPGAPSLRQLLRYRTGATALRADHPVFGVLVEVVEDEAIKLTDLAEQLRAWKETGR